MDVAEAAAVVEGAGDQAVVEVAACESEVCLMAHYKQGFMDGPLSLP